MLNALGKRETESCQITHSHAVSAVRGFSSRSREFSQLVAKA